MLFQKNIVKKYIGLLDEGLIAKAWEQYSSYFLNEDIQSNIHKIKEEQFQEGFLRELFVNVLGYTINPSPNYNLTTELKNEIGSKKADGAILIDDKVIGVIELKDHKTPDLASIENQAFGYKSKHKDTRLVIISNFEKLRFYIDNAVEYREWDIFRMTNDEFHELYLCLAWNQVERGIALQMKNESVSTEDQITNALYRDYSQFKRVLFTDIVAHNPYQEDNQWAADDKQWQLLLFKKTQKLLDRLLFIFFAEDCGLLPPNMIVQIVEEWEQLNDLDMDVPLYDRIKKHFGYLDTGYQGKKYEIFAYNGGLFKTDEVLDNLKISDDILAEHTRRLSEYDFESEVDVNILGHIFENSLSEIEEVTQQINSGQAPQTSKRKQDGVFYTPQYITKYIVENTVGRLCTEKKQELHIVEDEYFSDQRRQIQTKKRLLNQLQQYRNWLLEITILDPACGSGAFLNAALQFLMAEHKRLDEMEAKVAGSAIVFQDVENSILEHNLYGVDINEESVEIAQLALWLRTAKPHRKLNSLNENIKCGNSLISDPAIAGEKAFYWQKEFPKVFEKGGFDVVIGNPPYGASFKKDEKKYITSTYKSYRYKYESYVYFIEKAFDLVRDYGIIEYITPQLWLSLDESYNIRSIVLSNDLQTIRFYGEDAFPDAVVNTCSFRIQKKSPSDILEVTDIAGNKRFLSKYETVDEQSLKINFRLNAEQLRLVKKLRQKTVLLSDLGTVIQGITPYDKARGQSEDVIKTRAYHHTKKVDDSCGFWLDGQDVSRYAVCWGGTWLSYGEWLAAPREKCYFEGPRLLFREIPGHGKRLQASYYKDVAYYGHSISPFRLKEEDDCLLKAILALVNSALLSWYGALVLPNLAKDVFPKLNPKDIAQLPIPELLKNDRDMVVKFAELADIMLTFNSLLQEKRSRFVRRLSDNIEGVKITTALNTFDRLTFAEFLKELKKQKIKLSLKEQDNWEVYFNDCQAECRELTAQIDATDNEIDNRVFDLYGLTSEERDIVMHGV